MSDGAELRPRGPLAQALGRARHRPRFVVAVALLLFFLAMAVAPAAFTDVDPRDCDLARSLAGPTPGHWFGHDLQGCDVYARIVHGTSASLTVGIVTIVAAMGLSLLAGTVAGYYGGALDTVITRLADVMFGVPAVLGSLLILNSVNPEHPIPVLREPGVGAVSFVLALFSWPGLMRVVRATVLGEREKEYVLAARALGASDRRVIVRHLMPNAMPPLIVLAGIAVGFVILADAGLSFLGIGLRPPDISWGLMIDGQLRLDRPVRGIGSGLGTAQVAK